MAESGKPKAFFFEGRRTMVVASNLKEARSNMKRGGDKLVKQRELTEKELEMVKKGKWIRSYHKPGTVAPADMRGYGGVAPKKHVPEVGKWGRR